MSMRASGVCMIGLLALLASPADAWARSGAVRQAGNWGVGLGSGTLASFLSVKHFASADTAYQFNVGFHRTNRRIYGDAIALGFDYLLEQPSITGSGAFELAWNVGPGLSLGLSDSPYRTYWIVGVSGVVGLEFLFNMIPIDVVIEYRPSLFFFNNNFNDRGRDGFAFDLVEFGAHIRYFF